MPAVARSADRITAVLERPGARLVYEVSGQGPAVVLIHGFGLDMRMWDLQAEPLAARFGGALRLPRVRRLRAVRPRRPRWRAWPGRSWSP